MQQAVFGDTRTRVAFDHALVAPDGHVLSPLTGWEGAEGVVLISPVMGACSRGPRFVQYMVYGSSGCQTKEASPETERLVYVLDGVANFDSERLTADSFAWFPPGDSHKLSAPEGCRLLVFEKKYEQLSGIDIPERVVGNLAQAPQEPFHGDPDALLSTLLPVESAFDMAVNVFQFKPGAALPFVETHVMEHGLYMRSGSGVYRLANQWYPVAQGDTIWMASYCPQWFVAIGKENASYIYYKDINRDPLTQAPD